MQQSSLIVIVYICLTIWVSDCAQASIWVTLGVDSDFARVKRLIFNLDMQLNLIAKRLCYGLPVLVGEVIKQADNVTGV